MQLAHLDRSAVVSGGDWVRTLIVLKKDHPCVDCGKQIARESKPMRRIVHKPGRRFPVSEHLCDRCEGRVL